MKTPSKIINYIKSNMTEVMHTTLNPDGPGVVRIHLVPPVISEGEVSASVAIINGQDIVPVDTSWAVLLSLLIKEINRFSGKPINESDTEIIIERTVVAMRKIYPFLSKKLIREDIYTVMKSFTQIAKGEIPDEDIEYMTMGEYAPFMRAPHRMDLLVSAMTKDGCWHCNQQCVHCYAAGQVHAEEKELSTKEWKTIIDKCRKYCIPQLTFTGGEPTMREDLVELIDYSKWFVTRLNTNGIKLTEAYCEALRKASLDSCQITFYSDSEEIHNELVGAKQYQNTLKGIKNALKAGLNISINTPLCTLNADYKKTLQFLHELGVMYVTCSGLITTGNAATKNSEKLQLTPEELTGILREAVEYCHSNNMEISFTSPGWIQEEEFNRLRINKPACGACLSNMAITPSGNVVPCQSFLSGEPLGSILSDDWNTIWNSEECQSRRDYSSQMTGLCPLRKMKEETK